VSLPNHRLVRFDKLSDRPLFDKLSDRPLFDKLSDRLRVDKPAP